MIERCVWKWDADNEYKTACDGTYIVPESDWAYCPLCGKRIVFEDDVAWEDL